MSTALAGSYAQVDQMAHAAAAATANRYAGDALCPKCGGSSVAFLQRVQSWEAKRKSRRTWQTIIGIVGFLLVATTTAGCGSAYPSIDSHALKGMALWALFTSSPFLLVLFLVRPGEQPRRHAVDPSFVRFS